LAQLSILLILSLSSIYVNSKYTTNKQKIIVDGNIKKFLFVEDRELTKQIIDRFSNIETKKGRSA